jgi:hypothetical protein
MTSFFDNARRLAILGVICAVAITAIGTSSSAQATAPGDSARPVAAPADVRSIDAILHAAYDVISGPAGPRDWNRFNSLFAPGARLIRTQRDSGHGPHLNPMSPQEFASLAGEYFSKSAFYEGEIGREVNTFGAVTQVFSAYQSRHAPSDAKPFARGVNSFQLFNDGTRWYIVTIYWDDEHPGASIPDRYLHGAH